MCVAVGGRWRWRAGACSQSAAVLLGVRAFATQLQTSKMFSHQPSRCTPRFALLLQPILHTVRASRLPTLRCRETRVRSLRCVRAPFRPTRPLLPSHPVSPLTVPPAPYCERWSPPVTLISRDQTRVRSCPSSVWRVAISGLLTPPCDSPAALPPPLTAPRPNPYTSRP